MGTSRKGLKTMGRILLDMQKINTHFDNAIKSATELENGLYHLIAKGRIVPDLEEAQLALVLYLDGISRAQELDNYKLNAITLIAVKNLRNLQKKISETHKRSHDLSIKIEEEMSEIMQYLMFDIHRQKPWKVTIMEQVVYVTNGIKFAKEADALALASEVFNKTGVVIAVEKTVVTHRIRFNHLYSSNSFSKKYGHDFLQQVVTCPSYEIVWWHGEFDSLFKVSKRKEA
jgi:hypothetical protein